MLVLLFSNRTEDQKKKKKHTKEKENGFVFLITFDLLCMETHRGIISFGDIFVFK